MISALRAARTLSTTGFFCSLLIACSTPDQKYNTWTVYRGDDGINAYSSLQQINRENVKNLEVAWTYRSGDHIGNSTIQCNPLIINGVLYGISPRLKVFALDAKTGKQLWIFNPFEENSMGGGNSRGLTYWADGGDQRLFVSAGHRLLSLDARTGEQVMSFGTNGYVDLRKGLRNDEDIEKYFIENTSPGVVYNDMIILGSRMGETYQSLPGHIRAYDVRSGALRWIFNTVPQPGEFGYDTWPEEKYNTAGGCNAWSGLSIDRKRGMIFAATGAPSFDFHGGDRAGANLFGNCVIAIDAATGKYIWHFQVSHHDLWDYDLPSPPNLITVARNGRKVDAVAQITKQGWIFVFDRESGTPLFPVVEKPVPRSVMGDEHSSPTQPFPLKPAPLARQTFDTALVTDISPQARQHVLKELEKYTWGPIYLPPNTSGTIQMPGFRGGGEWSGGAFDPETGIMYVGTNDIPNAVQLEEVVEQDPDEVFRLPVLKAGERVFQQHCASCHGADRRGIDPFPSLANIRNTLTPAGAREIVEKGRAKMPAFMGLPVAHREAVIAFLFDLKNVQLSRSGDSLSGSGQLKDTARRYKIKGYTQLTDHEGYPGIKPPWGLLNAVDLNSGEIIWRTPLGEFPELVEKGITGTGTQLFGGGVVTAGGLVFIGASKDEKFRAIDKETGNVLWEYKLPAGGYATPAIYQVDGRQYVVIAAGGGGLQATKSGDYYISFALRE